MADRTVAKAVDVELEALQLDDMLIGHEVDHDGGEIWIAGARAEARELRNLEVDHVVALAAWVRPRLQLIVGDGLLPIFQCRRRLVAHSRSCVSSWRV